MRAGQGGIINLVNTHVQSGFLPERLSAIKDAAGCEERKALRVWVPGFMPESDAV